MLLREVKVYKLLHHNSKSRFAVLLGFLLVLSFLLLLQFVLNPQVLIIDFNLMELSSTLFNFSIILDLISLSFSFMVLLIAMCVYMFASSYMSQDLYFSRFIWILSMFVLSMNLLIFSGSLFSLLMGWDGLGITSFALIIYYPSSSSLSAGFITMLTNRLGDVFIMSSMCFLTYLGQYNLYSYSEVCIWLVFLWLMASLTKSAQYPFSAWLPEAMAAPTPVSALVHSSTLVTAGVYLLIRLSLHSNLNSEMLTLLSFVGSMTCLLGGSCAMYENDVKKVVALSTLSQLGLMVYSLSLDIPYLTLFHLYMHALFKALLFLCVGYILMMAYGNQDMRLMGGLLLNTPLLSIFFNLSSFCLMSIPFVNAYYSKHIILEAMFSSSVNFLSLLGIYLGSILTAAYMVRFMMSLNWGYANMKIISLNLSLLNYFPLFLLGIMSLIGGKVFLYYDLSLLLINFIPLVPMWMINMTFILGIFLGMCSGFPKSSMFFSTMWFINPFNYGLTSLFNQLQYCLNQLEIKWLSPLPLLYKFKASSIMFNNFTYWPTKSKGPSLSIIMVSISVIFLCHLMF
uniref:NADH dehydrogenase subunit 5 n=1 Tax=Arion flagellus TaxID=236857 RepID=UPI00240F5F0D|nr:NADH dehydrogenase subunit 5 [Arion flagellus]WES82233.1 NADH dehydrogenase subunit 5 [Arion flagellus]